MSFRLLIAFAFVVAVSGLSGTASAQGENFSPNTDRPGNDFRNTVIGNAEACSNSATESAIAAHGRSSRPASRGHRDVVGSRTGSQVLSRIRAARPVLSEKISRPLIP